MTYKNCEFDTASLQDRFDALSKRFVAENAYAVEMRKKCEALERENERLRNAFAAFAEWGCTEPGMAAVSQGALARLQALVDGAKDGGPTR